jgi:hypothetical protein
MSEEKRTYFTLISRSPDGLGHLLVIFEKQTWYDGALREEDRRASAHEVHMWPGDDVESILANNSADIVRQGFPAVSAEDVADIKVIADRLWTDDLIAARHEEQARLAEEYAAREATRAADAARFLPKWKFWAQLDIANKVKPFRETIAAMPDDKQRAIVNAQLDHEAEVRSDNAMIRLLLEELGIDVDAFWADAHQLKAT